MLDALRELDELKMPYDKLFSGYGFNFGELRIGPYRIFVCLIAPDEYLLLHIFRKQDNETPEQEVNRALKHYFDWKARTEEPDDQKP